MSEVKFKRKMSRHIKVILTCIIFIFVFISMILDNFNYFILGKLILGIICLFIVLFSLVIYLSINKSKIVFIVNEDGFIDKTKFGFGCITWNYVQKVAYESHYYVDYLTIQTKNTDALLKLFKERKVKRIYKRYLSNHIIYISLGLFDESPEEVVKIMQGYLNMYNDKN